jgi:hypothetical protein
MNRDDLHKDDRVCRWWDSGAFGMELMPLTVVRVNRVTATVKTDQGDVGRVRFDDLLRHIRPDEDF